MSDAQTRVEADGEFADEAEERAIRLHELEEEVRSRLDEADESGENASDDALDVDLLSAETFDFETTVTRSPVVDASLEGESCTLQVAHPEERGETLEFSLRLPSDVAPSKNLLVRLARQHGVSPDRIADIDKVEVHRTDDGEWHLPVYRSVERRGKIDVGLLGRQIVSIPALHVSAKSKARRLAPRVGTLPVACLFQFASSPKVATSGDLATFAILSPTLLAGIASFLFWPSTNVGHSLVVALSVTTILLVGTLGVFATTGHLLEDITYVSDEGRPRRRV